MPEKRPVTSTNKAIAALEQGIESLGKYNYKLSKGTGRDTRGFYFKVHGKKHRISQKEIHDFKLTQTEIYDYTRDILIHSDSFRPYIPDPKEKFVIVRMNWRLRENVIPEIGFNYVHGDFGWNCLIVDYQIFNETGFFAEEIPLSAHGQWIMIDVLNYLRTRNSKTLLDETYETPGSRTLDCFHQYLEQSYEIPTTKRAHGFSFKLAGIEYDCLGEDILNIKTDDGHAFFPGHDVQICPKNYVPIDEKPQEKIVWIRTKESHMEATDANSNAILYDGKTIGMAVWINPKDQIKRSGRNFEYAFDEIVKFLAGASGPTWTTYRPRRSNFSLR